MADNKPEVAVIMGSASDWETMKHACEMLDAPHPGIDGRVRA